MTTTIYQAVIPFAKGIIMDRRANITEKKIQVKSIDRSGSCIRQVFIYEDHRTVLNILDHFRREQPNFVPLNIVYFDFHSDSRNPVSPLGLRQQYRQSLPTQKEFWSFVEWETAHDDGDWLKTGMDLGLIRDAVLIGARHRDGLNGLVTDYIDVAGITHKIYDVCHIWCGLKDNGWLVDSGQWRNLSAIWDILGWQNDAGKFSFMESRENVPPFVLDFDLDYFTTDGPTGIDHVVWSLEQVLAAFGQRLPPDNFAQPPVRPIDFLQRLSAYCSFITIARESAYCGGFRASASILEILDALIFNGSLNR